MWNIWCLSNVTYQLFYSRLQVVVIYMNVANITQTYTNWCKYQFVSSIKYLVLPYTSLLTCVTEWVRRIELSKLALPDIRMLKTYARATLDKRIRFSITINGHLSKQATLHFCKPNDCLSTQNVNNSVNATNAAI